MSKRENFTCEICGEVRAKPFIWPARDTNKNIVQACVDCYKAQGMPTTFDAAIKMIYQMQAAGAAKVE